MKDKTKRKITDNLLNALLSSGSNRGRVLIETLLTPTERIMIAKRLAIIVMLENDHTYYRISKTLKVSTSTLKRLHKNLAAGWYRPIQNMIRKRNSLSFLELLEVLLAAGMPSIAGPRYQKRLDELRRKSGLP